LNLFTAAGEEIVRNKIRRMKNLMERTGSKKRKEIINEM
jgi:hypothetical protein